MKVTLTVDLDSPEFDSPDFARTLQYTFGFIAGAIDVLTEDGKNMDRLTQAGGAIKSEHGEPLGRWQSERPVPPGETLHSVPDSDQS